MLTADEVRQIFDYDPRTGIFSRRVTRGGALAGEVRGRLDRHGYLSLAINKVYHLAHRVAWLHFYGEWPSDEIDHINRCPTDNRIANLRVVTRAENARNRRCVRAVGL